MKELGKRLKAAREAKGISYYRVQKDTGLRISVIHNIEDGRGRAISVIKLCDYLGVIPTII